MKVVHVCSEDGDNGTDIAAYRLHSTLLRLGHDSRMFVAWKHRDDPTVTVFRPSMRLAVRLRRRLRDARINRDFSPYKNRGIPGWEPFFDDRTRNGADPLAQLSASDVVNIHSMWGFIDYQAFFSTVPQRTPVVRTLHDMSVFTGGCHYDAGCGKYTAQCGACPQLGSRKEQDLSRRIWLRKQVAFSAVPSGRLHLVAPTLWLAHEAERSSLLHRFPKTVIPLGLDTKVFCPRDRGLAREILGIPPESRVVLFVAQPITRVIKGFVFLAEALDGLDHLPNLLLLSVGGGQPPVKVKVPHLHLGHIDRERFFSLVYSAADVFAIPSLQDNHPLTAVEATACGTPVVGFAVGGIPDIVRDGVTGILVQSRDVIALRTAISNLLQDPDRRAEMAGNCRRIAVEEYDLEVQAQRYVNLYKTILAA